MEIQLREGEEIMVAIKNSGPFFYYFDGAIGGYVGLNMYRFGVFYSNIWQSLGIQWRSSDHKARYQLDEGEWTDWLPAAGEWSGGPDTIFIKANNGISFFDDIRENEVAKNAKIPVLIVPGIVGTELWSGDDYIWANLNRMFTDINDQFLTDNLSLDTNGNSLREISAKKVIEKIAKEPFLVNIFRNLISDLEINNYTINDNIFLFPYDWRLDLNEIKEDLNQKISEIKTQTGSSKVDIIAHSIGGLLAKTYVDEYGGQSINKLIFVGAPHIGAPKSGKVLLRGDNFSIPWLEPKRVEELLLNMSSLHQLLPDQEYFNGAGGYIKPFSFLNNLPFYNYNQTKDYFIPSITKYPKPRKNDTMKSVAV